MGNDKSNNPLMHLEPPTPVWEVMTQFNKRSAFGRVVVNPPERMAPLVPHATGEAWFICAQCGYACMSGDKMVEHKDSHTRENLESNIGNGENQDENVNQGGDEAAGVGEQISPAGINRKTEKCRICDKEYSSTSTLRRHEMLHNPKMAFRCNKCGAKFKLKDYLRKHINSSHQKNGVNRCHLCPCRFESEQGLKLHRVLYHSKKEKQASRKSMKTGIVPQIRRKPSGSCRIRKMKKNLLPKVPAGNVNVHGQILSKQTVARIYGKSRCPHCAIEFTNHSNMLRHVKNVHNNQRGRVKCQFCSCIFLSQSTASVHISTYHNDKLDKLCV